ncbi:MAG: hypothetical protein CMJ84_01760 [Planctomycetes bacterium]|nr:hypothetical protein [Planctomycetota bacterium]
METCTKSPCRRPRRSPCVSRKREGGLDRQAIDLRRRVREGAIENAETVRDLLETSRTEG